MKRLRTHKSILLLVFTLGVTLWFTSCSNDDDTVELPIPTMTEIEVGSDNQGIIGRDFHFNVEIMAGDKIGTVRLNIDQLPDEDYTREWSFEISWDEFSGMKNATVHKHFDIPEEAPEGTYAYTITVTDENGTTAEDKGEVSLIDPANLTVDPELYIWSIENGNGDFYFVNETLENPENVTFTKNDTLSSNIQISNVKDDGIMYLLLIRKDQNHLPETVNDIDFSKAIVFDVYEHNDEEEVFTFWNTPYNSSIGDYERWPELTIGAENDNNAPQANPVSGEKAWENGTYYFGVVYTNSTHHLSMHHYMEVTVEGF
ncbi:protein of unknown function [Sinomicrobium oceani]|uniref:DUF4625 domain-containing protein n=1 Tax=Sinomicrobium oceani TaxID=1150368 RepID=A0A1K1M7A0_9FLAO|nr:DUF4625 domain-containing protein [Sinomicrobium oceani]SFW19005.1 protein of unknown function [Sinomicrobium oceani]